MNSKKAHSATSTKAASNVSPDLFIALRNLLLANRADLAVVHDQADHVYVNCKQADPKGKAQFFGAVKVSGRRHAFHFMPVYDFPDLLDAMSPALKKRMQGKSCFNFESLDPALLHELQMLVAQGVCRYKSVGKL